MKQNEVRDVRTRTDDATAIVRRDEWLLDEAIMETFPASDPVAPYQHASDSEKPAVSPDPRASGAAPSAGIAG